MTIASDAMMIDVVSPNSIETLPLTYEELQVAVLGGMVQEHIIPQEDGWVELTYLCCDERSWETLTGILAAEYTDDEYWHA